MSRENDDRIGGIRATGPISNGTLTTTQSQSTENTETNVVVGTTTTDGVLIAIDSTHPNWYNDNASNSCLICHIAFSMLFRRHHCRQCGVLCCWKCSTNRIKLFYPLEDQYISARVCDRCIMGVAGGGGVSNARLSANLPRFSTDGDKRPSIVISPPSEEQENKGRDSTKNSQLENQSKKTESSTRTYDRYSDPIVPSTSITKSSTLEETLPPLVEQERESRSSSVSASSAERGRSKSEIIKERSLTAPKRRSILKNTSGIRYSTASLKSVKFSAKDDADSRSLTKEEMEQFVKDFQMEQLLNAEKRKKKKEEKEKAKLKEKEIQKEMEQSDPEMKTDLDDIEDVVIRAEPSAQTGSQTVVDSLKTAELNFIKEKSDSPVLFHRLSPSSSSRSQVSRLPVKPERSNRRKDTEEEENEEENDNDSNRTSKGHAYLAMVQSALYASSAPSQNQ